MRHETMVVTIEHTTSLIAQNVEFKVNFRKKKIAIAALKNELRKFTGNSVNIKFARTSILGKLVLQPHRNQLVVRQPIVFKSERPRISKPRFASQVNVNNDLSKPVTTHYLPKEKEFACAKPNHMIASSSSRYNSIDLVHNHYLEEAKKKTQEKGRNSRPSVMPSARSQSTTNDSKPKPKINNQKSRDWPASKNGCITTKTVPIAEHSRNSSNLSDPKHFVCSTCQKCVFNANHDACVTKFLNKVNSRAKVPSCTLNSSADTSFNPKKEGLRVCSELGIHDHSNEPSSSKLVPKVIPPPDKTATSQQELELLFSPMYEEYFNAGNRRNEIDGLIRKIVKLSDSSFTVFVALRRFLVNENYLHGDSLCLPDHSRFQQNYGKAHWIAGKNILKYLRNTKDMVLVYGGKPKTELKVTCYTDASFQTDKDDTKSQLGYVFLLNGGAVVTLAFLRDLNVLI
ncbi:hypothetical protein Tco_0312157 [Tanacetum coccineum]